MDFSDKNSKISMKNINCVDNDEDAAYSTQIETMSSPDA